MSKAGNHTSLLVLMRLLVHLEKNHRNENFQIFVNIYKTEVDLDQGALNLVSTIEELLGRKSSGSGLEKPRLQS
jgi:hypothetical protein